MAIVRTVESLKRFLSKSKCTKARHTYYGNHEYLKNGSIVCKIPTTLGEDYRIYPDNLATYIQCGEIATRFMQASDYTDSDANNVLANRDAFYLRSIIEEYYSIT